MNPNNHNGQFAPGSNNEPQPPGQPHQPYYGSPEMPAPQTQQQPYAQPQAQPPNQLPEQQYGGGQEAGQGHHERFDFIMKPEPAKRPLAIGLPGGGSKTMRIAILGIGFVVLVMVIGGFLSFLNKPKFSTTALVGIAQEQAEIVRVADIGTTKATNQSVINSSYTLKYSISSDGNQLLTYLAKNHAKLSQKQLILKKNLQTDARLGSALTASTFDPTFVGILQTQLQAYQKDLKAAYNANPGPNGQKILAAEYTNAGLLVALLAQLQQ